MPAAFGSTVDFVTEQGIGQTIRDARVRSGITIEQLSHITKISQTLLRAMEAEDLDRLPGGVFTRGFFRTYAREVGLDPDATVARLIAQTRDAEPVEPPTDSDPVEADDAPVSERASDLAQMILIAIIVATVGYLGLHNRAEPTIAASGGASAPVTREVPVGTSGTIAAGETPAPRTAPELRLELQAIGPCWIAASADGNPAAARLMDSGDSQVVVARDEIRLRVGDPASVSFSLNGAAGKSLGDSGQAVSIRITPQNVGEFQAR